MRVSVDRSLCRGQGQCTFAAPGIFSMGGDDRPVHPDLVPQGMESEAEDAAALCPMQAITLTQD